jgi:hypothetical protein
MKHSAKKLLSLLLALLMTVSLMGGTLVYAASDELLRRQRPWKRAMTT